MRLDDDEKTKTSAQQLIKQTAPLLSYILQRRKQGEACIQKKEVKNVDGQEGGSPTDAMETEGFRHPLPTPCALTSSAQSSIVSDLKI